MTRNVSNLSMVGMSRPGTNRRLRCLERDCQQQGQVKAGGAHYMLPLKREHVVEPMGAEMLAPLIDLAYWSNFFEVRRDSASAFAALSMNKDNLPIMAQAGALGAILALIGDGSRQDHECIRNATIALAQLVKLPSSSERFLAAPRGLQIIFRLARESSKTIRTQALRVLINVANSSPDSSKSIVDGGGLLVLYPLLDHRNQSVRLTAGTLFGAIAHAAQKHHNVLETVDTSVLSGVIRTLVREFPDAEDELEASLLDFCGAIALLPASRITLVQDCRAADVLLDKLRYQYLPVESIVKVVRCVGLLLTEPKNRLPVLADGRLLSVLDKVVFIDVPGRFGLASLSSLGTLDLPNAEDQDESTARGCVSPLTELAQLTHISIVEDSACSRIGGRCKAKESWEAAAHRLTALATRQFDEPASGACKLAATIAQANSPPLLLIRQCVAALCELCHPLGPDGGRRCQIIVESRILQHVFPVCLKTFKRDRRICRAVAVLLERMVDALSLTSNPHVYAQLLNDDGLLDAVETHLTSDDILQKCSSVKAMAALLSRSRGVLNQGSEAFFTTTIVISSVNFLVQPGVLRELVALTFLRDVRVPIAMLLSIVLIHAENVADRLVKFGAVDVLTNMIAECRHHCDLYLCDLLQAFARLVPLCSEDQRYNIVRSSAFKVINRISKLEDDHAARGAAFDILSALGHQVASLKVATAMVGFMRRMRGQKIREILRASKRKGILDRPAGVPTEAHDSKRGRTTDGIIGGQTDTASTRSQPTSR